MILSAVLLGGCGSKQPFVLVGSGRPDYSEGSEWFHAFENAGRLRTTKWRTKYSDYSQSLVHHATATALDSASLSNVLQVILADAPLKRRAYVPFAAYSDEIEHKHVWVVHLVWEYEGSDTRLWHHCSYTINPQDLSDLGFVTCM
jgi:hypothetical protein